jgi:hypothetical protein
MKKQLTKARKTYLHLQILRKMKQNPEFKKKVIEMAQKNQKKEKMEEETEQEAIRAEAIRRLKLHRLGKQLKDQIQNSQESQKNMSKKTE